MQNAFSKSLKLIRKGRCSACLLALSPAIWLRVIQTPRCDGRSWFCAHSHAWARGRTHHRGQHCLVDVSLCLGPELFGQWLFLGEIVVLVCAWWSRCGSSRWGQPPVHGRDELQLGQPFDRGSQRLATCGWRGEARSGSPSSLVWCGGGFFSVEVVSYSLHQLLLRSGLWT